LKTEKPVNIDMLDNLKEVLQFYQVLGFERLPIKLAERGKRLPAGEELKGQAGPDKKFLLRNLREEMGDCDKCKLSGKRTNIVFGEGNPDARLMFIGEAPGREEDRQARPFVGDAGKLLTRLIEKMGFKYC
jgi:hypothetical protein